MIKTNNQNSASVKDFYVFCVIVMTRARWSDVNSCKKLYINCIGNLYISSIIDSSRSFRYRYVSRGYNNINKFRYHFRYPPKKMCQFPHLLTSGRLHCGAPDCDTIDHRHFFDPRWCDSLREFLPDALPDEAVSVDRIGFREVVRESRNSRCGKRERKKKKRSKEKLEKRNWRNDRSITRKRSSATESPLDSRSLLRYANASRLPFPPSASPPRPIIV